MATEVLMPKLGLTMTEGTIEEWKVKEGDTVKKGDIILSVATDKLTNDVEAEADGVLLKIVVNEGETVPCKQVIAYLGAAGEAIPAAGASVSAPAAAPAAAPVAKTSAPMAPAAAGTVTVIGGGPGGYVAAIRAAQLGAKVTIIEKDRVGGTCLNRGCIPTKSLMQCAETYEAVKNASKYGVAAGDISYDWTKIQNFRQGISDKLVSGVQGLLKMNKAKLIQGEARFTGNKTVTVTKKDGSTETITSDKVIIACGSEPAIPPIPGIDCAACIDSTKALTLDKIPESMLIIGGGVIGLELGTVYNSFGTKITVVEALPRLLPAMDGELTKNLQKQLTDAGLKIMLDSKVEKITSTAKGAAVTVKTASGEQVIEAEKVLVAVGRKVNPTPLNIEATGLASLDANDKMETSVPGIYCIGDANKKWMLAYTAMYMGEIAAANCTGGDMTFDRKAIPSVIFLGPEFACVGLTEEEVKEKGIAYKVGRFPMAGNGRSLIMGETAGMIKVISDTKYNEILGVHMVGPRACDMIGEASLALHLECTVDEWINTPHAHPTVTEAMREAMLAVNKLCLHGANK